MSKVYVRGFYFHTLITLTPDDWQLYDRPGRDDAAWNMNRELENCLREGNLTDIYSRVLKPYTEFGATDTEPRYVIEGILRQIAGQTNLIDEAVYTPF